ncbi:alcohol acetyltransferase-domain-containing protein [Paraphysoderma sedebokerense]|nr:alcohol acetyltransferase-domain-containing protein [Paraphysoderma sedebokerense]
MSVLRKVFTPKEPVSPADVGVYRRKLSSIEKVYHSLNSIDMYFSVSSSIRIKSRSFPSARVEASTLYRTLRKALVALLSRHEVLSCYFDTSSKDPAFRLLPRDLVVGLIDLTILSRTHDDQVVQILEEEANRKFETNELQWRVILLTGQDEEGNVVLDLVLSIHHALADGKSTITLLRDILQSWNTVLLGKSDMVNTIRPTTCHILGKSGSTLAEVYTGESKTQKFMFPIPNPLRVEICPKSRTPFHSLLEEMLLNLVLPQFVVDMISPSRYITGTKQVSPEEVDLVTKHPSLYPTRIVHFGFTPSEIKILKEWTRNHKVTINSLVAAAFLFVLSDLAKTHNPDDGRTYSEVKLKTAIDARPWLTVPVDSQLGVYSTIFSSTHFIHLSLPFSPSLVQQVHEEIQRDKKNGLQLIHQMSFVKNWNNFFKKQRKTTALDSSGKRESLIMSNLGHMKLFDELNLDGWNSHFGGEWKVDKLLFSQSSQLLSPLTLSFVSTTNGCEFTAAFREDVFEYGHVSAAVQRVKDMVLTLGSVTHHWRASL